jgi:hypothetical protein
MPSFSLVENPTAREDLPPRHQGKIHREDGEVREERFHHRGAEARRKTGGLKAVRR